MYQDIYRVYQVLSKGDKAELKRCSLKKLADSPAYFHTLKLSHKKDTQQVQRILYLLCNLDVSEDVTAKTVAQALLAAGVKESQIIQITRSGDNGIEYLKRQLIRCKKIQLDSLGKLAQFWGDNARRNLLKDFILSAEDKYEVKTKEQDKIINTAS